MATDTDTPLLALENETKPAVTKALSESTSMVSAEVVDHYVYRGNGGGQIERRPLWPFLARASEGAPKRVLITGGASCPDGIIQQVITRMNSFFLPETLRPMEDVLRELATKAGD